MSDAVAEETAESDTEAVGRIPESDSDGLLAAGVPHACDEHESRVAGLLAPCS